MKITILAIGKKHDPKLESAISDYSKRLMHYTNFEWHLAEAKITQSMSELEIKKYESDLLLKNIKSESRVILLDERGTKLDTLSFSEKIQTLKNSGQKDIVFLIGGAYGVNEDLMKRADFIWSLSPLVFPHQLVRLILIEQLYRAHTILAGEKYHHI